MPSLSKKAAVVTLCLAWVLVPLMPASARADNLQGQPIYARNNTNHPIWVACRYVPPGGSSYVTNGWWQVNPGQSVLILYNNAQYIYFYAHNDCGTSWDGNDACTVVRGETVHMFQADTGTGYDC
jgi:uncharacterized membrane protein